MKRNLAKMSALCLGALVFFGCEKEEDAMGTNASASLNAVSQNCYTIDFENFSASDYPISQVSGAYGTVGIFAKKREANSINDDYTSTNVARVYDARVHTGDDGHDLGVPDHLGKMLIANQYTPAEVAANPNGLDAQGHKFSDPSDNAWGATLALDFSAISNGVFLKSIDVVDVDLNHVVEDQSYVRVIDAKNQEYNFPLTPYKEEGSVQTVTLNVASAKKLMVVLDGVNTSVGSGAIDNVVFCVDKPVIAEPTGCTRTQGYWKNHANGKKADPAWGNLANTTFYTSGQTYLKVLNTPPKGGNEYYILAHQYIAAKLNMTAGASMPANVKTAFDKATAYFTNPSASTASRGTIISWADILDKYNNGKMGVSHCD
ncbi:hypothetical protein [uncultured Pontibacter sp.]|uniref:hypothetical protein n=1 Tax=uncultured Pontibacter sp. TaxID=453356 RepID=UPI002632CA15|nr:hypothetical protein [uncultured Pontibacter sp.]